MLCANRNSLLLFQSVSLFSLLHQIKITIGFPGGSVVENPSAKARLRFIPGLEESLEKEMATPSSILAWAIPKTKEPSGLQTMGLPKSDLVTKQQQGLQHNAEQVWREMISQPLITEHHVSCKCFVDVSY